MTSGDIVEERFSEVFARKFLGGNGFAAAIIGSTVPARTDPFSPENVLVFATGPFTGSGFWSSSRGHCAAISPLTGYFADSNFGGAFAMSLKRSGYDAVVLAGKAEEPVYVSIRDGRVELKNAGLLWGKTVSDAHAVIAKLEGNSCETALIGPGGENGVLYAAIMCSGARLSAAGRGGLGAVMGAKNCKGLAVQGSREITVADGERLKGLLKAGMTDLKEKTRPLTETGTPVLVDTINGKGKLGTRNNNGEVFERAGQINGKTIITGFKVKNVACHGCPVACGKTVRVPDGEFSGETVKMPEYETIYSLGSMLDNGDLASIFNGNAMCDEMGIDTISFGVTLAFLTECVEKNIIGNAKEPVMDLLFGDGQPLAELVKAAAFKEGHLGALLAMGSEKAADLMGGDAWKLLYSVKGMEIAGHSARGLRNMGLAYATSTRGGSHHDARPSYYPNDPAEDPGFEHQPEYCVNSQHNTALGDSLVICRFVQERALGTQINEAYLPFISSITGWDMKLDELKSCGERIYNLERLINMKRGVCRSKDVLPYRVTNEPIPAGPSQGWFCPVEKLDALLDAYYGLRGWSNDGTVTPEKARELGLEKYL